MARFRAGTSVGGLCQRKHSLGGIVVMQSAKFAGLIVGLQAILTGGLTASDWPTWRHDAARTAATDEQLPDHPIAMWSRELGPNHVAWQEDTRLQFDASYEPIVVDKTLLVASARTNSVSAYHTETGEQLWQYHVATPVRLAPFAHQDRVYFGADDGKFYCLDVATGTLSWSVDAAPSGRMILGNERLISAWPVRGGVVIHENRALFTVGVWPFEGCFVCEVNVDGGPPALKSKILEDITPQGHLALAGGRLFIPTGRGNATCLDADTLELVPIAYSSTKGLTDSHVTSCSHAFFHGDAVYDLKSNTQLDIRLTKPAMDGSVIFGMRTRVLKEGEKDAQIIHEAVSYDLDKRTDVESRDRRGNPIVLHQVPELWSSDLKGLDAADPQQPPQFLLKAGHQLIGVQGNSAFALGVTDQSSPPSVLWQLDFPSHPASAIAADGKLFVTTTDGTIHCFGAQLPASTDHKPTVHQRMQVAFGPSSRWTQDVATILQLAPSPRGQCIVLGSGSGALIEELLQQSQLTLHILQPDAKKAMTLRARLAALGLLGQRANVFETDLQHVQLPPYLATLIVSEDLEQFGPLDKVTRALFPCLRPYGGSMVFKASDAAVQPLSDQLRETSFAGAQLARHDEWHQLTRVGALPGSADWSHEYGDPSNTLMSHDELVKAPLGVLWFGGPASHGDLYFDRHYWGPGLTVVEGRMIVEGPNKLTSIDIYTGEILWQRALRSGSGPGREGNFFDGENPGFHFVASQEYIYLVYPDMCLVLNSQTGTTASEFRLPQQDDQWGKIRIWKDLLLVMVFQQTPQGLLPKAIQAMNRHRGTTVWRQEAHSSVPLLAIGGDRVYCFDGHLQEFYDAWKRRGLTPESIGYRALRCFDVTTGKQMWERTSDRVATWMSYSPDHDILVVSNKQGIDALQAGDGNGLWKKESDGEGFVGHPEHLWDKVILSGDQIIDQRGPGKAYDIHTGKPMLHINPMTMKEEDWQFTRTGHHCNYAIASPHLLTFRSDTAGFFDRSMNATGRLNGFRAGCRNSLIPAGGILNAPNYAHGCNCNYNLFTSLALVHTPANDVWTYNAYASPPDIVKLGINLGAPGDRVDDDGALWLEYPPHADPSPSVKIETTGELKAFRLSTGQVSGESTWVGASGVEGIRRMSISLRDSNSAVVSSRVRLFFMEPHATATGARRFDIKLQGATVVEGLDVFHAAGGSRKVLVKSFESIAVQGTLDIDLTPSAGEPILCGVMIDSTPQP